jgi:eukaryotic-like serine/threonine-protein kinase
MDYTGISIEQYQVVKKLGQGGMATVYKAFDTRLERDVALKVVRKESIPPEQLARIHKRFAREARSLAKFLHPHIVPVHDYGEHQGAPYLVMAYLPGGTLKERIGRPVPVKTALEWILPIASALRYAHQRGVVHRDVKPSNILITEEQGLMLADFGIARVLEQAATQLTATGMGVGTPEYMAPEQWQGEAGPASDQYALGVVLYELLTGHKPYTADTPLAVALKVMSEPLRSPRALAPGIPEGVEKLLYKALARDPQDRYTDMAAFWAALESQLTGQPAKADETDQIPVSDAAPIAEDPEQVPSSEAETVDELVSTPAVDQAPVRVEPPQEKPHVRPRPRQPSRSPGREKTRLPGLALWVGAAALAVVVLAAGSALLSRGSRGSLPMTAEPTEEAVAQVEAPLPIATDAPESTATETPLLSPTATETPVPTPTLTPEPTLGIGSTMVNPVDDAVLVYVPEGEFLMGSEDADAWDREKPQRMVYLDAFWIYQHPVTNQEYQGCVDAGECNAPLNERYFSDSKYTDHPVVYVSWLDATAYCQWAGGRLPTEAEWEKAARGTDGRKYPWGNDSPSCSLANYSGCVGGTSPVGSYLLGASPYGALDMAGNVFEWVADWYAEEYYSRAPDENPTGPNSGQYRLLRGGSLYNNQRNLRVSYRIRNYPDYWLDYIGFRCLRSPEP